MYKWFTNLLYNMFYVSNSDFMVKIFFNMFFFLKFHFLKTRKLLFLFLKKNKRLQKITFFYYKNWQGDNSYLFVNFKFENAIYYRFGEYKSFDFDKPFILNLQKIKTDKIILEVFGFRQKQIFEIEIKKEIQLDSKMFETKISNLNLITREQRTNLKLADVSFFFSKPHVNIQNKSFKLNPIKLEFNKFIIKEYI